MIPAAILLVIVAGLWTATLAEPKSEAARLVAASNLTFMLCALFAVAVLAEKL